MQHPSGSTPARLDDSFHRAAAAPHSAPYHFTASLSSSFTSTSTPRAHAHAPQPSPAAQVHPFGTPSAHAAAPPPHPLSNSTHARTQRPASHAPPPGASQYELRVHALASSLLSQLTSGDGFGLDASLATLQRDPDTQPFAVARVAEMIEGVLRGERDTSVTQLRAEVSAKDAALDALRREFAAIQNASALKESLLHERAEILKEELLSTKAAESSAASLTQSVVPRLQSQLVSLQESVTREQALAASLAAELRRRDADLEATSAKYESLSEQFLQMQSVTRTLNERLLEQAAEVDVSRAVAHRASKTASDAGAEWAAKQEAIKAQAAADSSSARQRVLDLESRLERLTEDRAREEAALKESYAVKEAAARDAAEARLKEAQLNASHAAERLQARVDALEKSHTTELRYRTDEASAVQQELTSRLDASQRALRALQEEVAEERASRARSDREGTADAHETMETVSRAREDAARATAQLEAARAESAQVQAKYAKTVAQFERTLEEDESRFTAVLESERQRTETTRRRWADDVARLKRELATREEAMRGVENENADLQRHIKSQGDAVAAAARREEEIERRAHESSLTAATALSAATRAADEARQKAERLSLELRGVEKARDRSDLERESEARRWQAELEARLLAQKQSHAIDRAQDEKEIATTRAALEQARAQHEIALATAKQRSDEERVKWQAEAQAAFDKRLAEVHAAAPSQEQFDAQVKVAVDEHITVLNRTYLSPGSHASIVESKVEAARFEAARERHTLQTTADAQLLESTRAGEAQAAAAVAEVRAKYEAEYAATMAQVRSGCREYEDELERERARRADIEERLESASRTTRDATHERDEARQSLAHETAARAQLADQLEEGGRVIDKLKQLLASERRERESALEEARRRADADARHAAEAHAAALQLASAQATGALETARARADRDREELRAAMESVLAEETTKLNKSLAEARSEAAATAVRLEAEIRSAREETNATKRHASEAAHAATLHAQQLQVAHAAASAHLETALVETRAEAARARETERSRLDAAVSVEREARERDLAAAQADRARFEEESHARETELRANLEARTLQHAHQTRESSARITELDTRLGETRASFERAQARVASLTVGLEGVVATRIAALRTEHEQLQRDAREDLRALYATATNALAQMHTTTQVERRRALDAESRARDLHLALEEVSATLRAREEEFAATSLRHEEEIASLQQEHLLDEALARSAAPALQADVDALRSQIADLQANHAAQMARLRQAHEEECQDQMRHVEDLLRIKSGAFLRAGGGDTAGSTAETPAEHGSESEAEGGDTPSEREATTSETDPRSVDQDSLADLAALQAREGMQRAHRGLSSLDSSVNPGGATSSSSHFPASGPNTAAYRASASFRPPHSYAPSSHHAASVRQGEASFFLPGASVASSRGPGAPDQSRAHSEAAGSRTRTVESSPALSAISLAPSSGVGAAFDGALSGLASIAPSAAHSRMGSSASAASSFAASESNLRRQPIGAPLSASELDGSASGVTDVAHSATPAAASSPPAADRGGEHASAHLLLESLLQKVHMAMAQPAIGPAVADSTSAGDDATVAGSPPHSAAAATHATASSSAPPAAAAASLDESASSALDSLLETSFSSREYDQLMRAARLHRSAKSIAAEMETEAVGRSLTGRE